MTSPMIDLAYLRTHKHTAAVMVEAMIPMVREKSIDLLDFESTD